MPQANDIATNAANAATERWYITEIFRVEELLPSDRVHEIRQQHKALDLDGYLTALQDELTASAA